MNKRTYDDLKRNSIILNHKDRQIDKEKDMHKKG